MSDKVKLPSGVAEAIKAARECGQDNATIISFSFITEENGEHRNNMRDFAADNFDTFLQALVNGYEVEQTPEDKVREYFESQRDICREDQDPAPNAIEKTLRILGIKIDGINT